MPPTRAIAKLFLLTFSAPASLPAATIITIVTPQHIVTGPALAIGEHGFPVIAYRQFNQPLGILNCLRWDCEARSFAMIEGTEFAESVALSIAADGNPAIAYRNSLTGQVMLLKCDTYDCRGGGHEFRTIDPSGGPDVDFAFGPDGRAVFAYKDVFSGAFLLARCTTPGCGGVAIEVLRQDPSFEYAKEVAVVFAGRDQPVVAGHWSNLAGSQAMNFFDCSVQPCADSHRNIAFTPGQQRGLGVSMAVSPTDRPVIAYKDQSLNTLDLARCLAPDCAGPVMHAPLDQGSLGIGAFTAVAVRSDNRPVVAYQKHLPVVGGATALYVAQCDDPPCASIQRIAVDVPVAGGTSGARPDIAIDPDGAVVLAYYNPSTASLRLARCNAQTCEGPGDRLFQDGFQ